MISMRSYLYVQWHAFAIMPLKAIEAGKHAFVTSRWIFLVEKCDAAIQAAKRCGEGFWQWIFGNRYSKGKPAIEGRH